MLVQRWELEPWLEYSQVLLEPAPWLGGTDSTGNPAPAEIDDNVAVLNRAMSSVAGIAQGRYLTIFLTPHRDNSPLRVTVELWAERPPQDLEHWPEAFEATLMAGSDGILCSSPTMGGVFIPVAAGSYRAVIAGHDFLRRTWDSVTHPDNYRLQLWPDDDRIEPRRLSSWDHPSHCRCV